MWGDTPYLSVFSPNAGKYKPEKLRMRLVSRSEQFYLNISEVNLDWERSNMELLTTLVSKLKTLTIVAKNLILDA